MAFLRRLDGSRAGILPMACLPLLLGWGDGAAGQPELPWQGPQTQPMALVGTEFVIASPHTSASEAWFGSAVAVSGDRVLIGAPNAESLTDPADSGAVSLWNWGTGGFTTASGASGGAASDKWGTSVALSGTWLAWGGPGDDTSATNAGRVRIASWNGTTLTNLKQVVPSDGAAGDEFGTSVGLDGTTLVVGAPLSGPVGNDAGAAYVFVNSSNSWPQQAKLVASDAAANDRFGASVAISGDIAVVGAPERAGVGAHSGAAYVFSRSGATWSQQSKLQPAGLKANDRFGVSVAVSGTTVVVGAHSSDGTGTGAAYVFVRSGTTWQQQAKLLAADGAVGDGFGISVSIAGELAIIGANGCDDKGSMSGAAYVFRRSGAAWTQQVKLTASNGAAMDHFGLAVGISGNKAIVGARWSDSGGPQSGAAYGYVLKDPDGTACTEAGNCHSGLCVDGVCCDTECGGGLWSDCLACSKKTGAAQDGVCGPANGSSCDDANACTDKSVCNAGTCVGAGDVVCVALDECHEVGVCNPADGSCSAPVKADGSACSIGTCHAGVCTADDAGADAPEDASPEDGAAGAAGSAGSAGSAGAAGSVGTGGSVQADAGSVDSGVAGSADGGDAGDDGGCGCRTRGSGGAGAWALVLVALGGLVRRRRR